MIIILSASSILSEDLDMYKKYHTFELSYINLDYFKVKLHERYLQFRVFSF